MLCGKIVKCWDNTRRPCVRRAGHIEGHCNPFSDNGPPGDEGPTLYKNRVKEGTPVVEQRQQQSLQDLYAKVLKAAGLTLPAFQVFLD